VLHGFLRAPDGTITTFDAPGSRSTTASSINPAGAITGFYSATSGHDHGFVRATDGAFTTFDPPGSIYITPSGINPAGAITGYYLDLAFVRHDFLRAPDGTITTFDVPGATTWAFSINPAGAITGYYQDGTSFNYHGFLRAPDGIITTFDVPGALFTFPFSINPAGRSRGTTLTRAVMITASCGTEGTHRMGSMHKEPVGPFKPDFGLSGHSSTLSLFIRHRLALPACE
jgi:hypothetical protein